MCRVEESFYTLSNGEVKKEEAAFPCDKVKPGQLCADPRRIRLTYPPESVPRGSASPSPLPRRDSKLQPEARAHSPDSQTRSPLQARSHPSEPPARRPPPSSSRLRRSPSVTINSSQGSRSGPEIVVEFGGNRRNFTRRSTHYAYPRPMARQQIELSSSEVLNTRRDRLTEIERAENHELEALDEEERLANICGWRSGHDICTSDEFPPCVKPIATERGILGRSAKNEVDEVRMPGFTPVMARKRIFIERGKLAAARDHQQIQAEVRNLRSLNHEHIVKVLGCYAETIGKHQTFCLLIYPAAEEDLSHFLCEGCQPFSEEQKSWIGTWFGCLASALAYMQSQGIHHEDIKPSNIVHCGRHIYFTDFGSSRRLEADQDTSTDTPALASKLFAAPEAMPENGKLMGHGSKTDVYSLGLVYVEMLAAYLGNDISQMRDSFFGKSMQARRYSNVTNKIAEVLGQTDMWHSCLKGMLHPNRQSRPSAQEVVDTLSHDRFRKVVNRCSCQRRQRTNDPMPLIPRQQYIVGMRNWNGRPMSTRYHSDSNFVSAETSQSRRVHNEVHIANQPQARPVSTPMLSTRKGVLPTHSPRLTDIGAYEVYSSEGESAYDEEERPATERGHPGQSSHRVQPYSFSRSPITNPPKLSRSVSATYQQQAPKFAPSISQDYPQRYPSSHEPLPAPLVPAQRPPMPAFLLPYRAPQPQLSGDNARFFPTLLPSSTIMQPASRPLSIQPKQSPPQPRTSAPSPSKPDKTTRQLREKLRSTPKPARRSTSHPYNTRVLSKVTTTAEERMGLGFATPTPEEERDAKSVPKRTTTAQQKKNPTPAAPTSGKKGDDKSVPKRTTTAEERMGLGSAATTSKEERDAKSVPKRTATAQERMGLGPATPTSEEERDAASDDSATATVGRTASKASKLGGNPSTGGVLGSIMMTLTGQSKVHITAEALAALSKDLPKVKKGDDDDVKDPKGQISTNVADALRKEGVDEEGDGDAVGDTFVWVADSFGII